MKIRTDFSSQHPSPKLANIQPWASHLSLSPQFPSLHRGKGARCLPQVSSRVIFTTFVFVFSTSSKNNKLQDETHQESCNMGTRLCQGNTRLCLGGTKLCLEDTKLCLGGTQLCLRGTRLCLVGVRRTAQMNGFHLSYHVKFMLYKVEIHLDQPWFVHLVLLKQIRIVPEVAVDFRNLI